MTKPDLKNQVASSLRWNAIVKLCGQLINWAITLFVIRLLLPADYGLMAMSNVIIGFIVMIAEMGFGASLVQSATLDSMRIRQVWGAAILINTAACAFIAAAAPWIADFYSEPRLVLVVQVAALQFLLIAASLVPAALLRRELRFKRLSFVELGSGVFGNGITLALAYSGYGIWSLVFGALSIALFRAITLQIVAPVGLWPSFSFRGARRIVSFGASLTLSRILSYLLSQVDILIAGKMLGKAALGLYSVSIHLASLPMQRVSSIVNEIALSAFAKIQGDREAIASSLRLSVRIIALLAFPSLFGLALVAPELVRIAMGPKWVDAILPFQIIASIIPLRMVGTLISTAVISVGRVNITVFTNLVGTVVAVPLFLFASRYGIVGMSLGWAALAPLMLALTMYRGSSVLGVSVVAIMVDLARPVLASVLMAIAVTLTRGYLEFAGDGIRLSILVGTGIIVYCASTMLINRPLAREALQLLIPRRK
jgi:O-antigen/teichoic acid export membrane protein